MDPLGALLALAAIVTAIATALIIGARRWQAETKKLRAHIESAQTRAQPNTIDFRELDALPEPVRRYFRAALKERQPIITAAQLRHRGMFNMGPAGDRWRPFTSDQFVIPERPGFVWDARIAVAPGMAVRVHDAYVTGEGILNAFLYGLLPLARMRGGREMAEGELMRFLAEAVWYPTALLPSQGVKWEAVTGHSAQATLSDGAAAVTLLFSFDDSWLIDSVSTEARGRLVKGKFEPTAWKGRFWNYAERAGMQIPLEGEVAWMQGGNPRPYWRGLITDVSYDF